MFVLVREKKAIENLIWNTKKWHTDYGPTRHWGSNRCGSYFMRLVPASKAIGPFGIYETLWIGRIQIFLNVTMLVGFKEIIRTFINGNWIQNGVIWNHSVAESLNKSPHRLDLILAAYQYGAAQYWMAWAWLGNKKMVIGKTLRITSWIIWNKLTQLFSAKKYMFGKEYNESTDFTARWVTLHSAILEYSSLCMHVK